MNRTEQIENVKSLKIKINGMSCYISEGRIETGFGYLDGVKKVESNCQTGEFYCEYDPEIVTQEQIIERLKEMDFDVIEIDTLP